MSSACEFVIQPCKGLALAIEKQTEKAQTDTQEVEQLCRQYLNEMGIFGDGPGQIDTLVLGCTHYVFVEEILRQMVGTKVNIISTGTAVARQAHRLSAIPTPASGASEEHSHNASTDTIQLWTTGSLSALEHAAERWLSLPPQCCHWIAPSAP